MTTGREYGRWCGTSLKDMRGQYFQVGDEVAKAVSGGRSVNLSICKVTRIEDGRMYLDESHVAVRYPGRMLIVKSARIQAIADSLERTIETKRLHMETLATTWLKDVLSTNIDELALILKDIKETY